MASGFPQYFRQSHYIYVQNCFVLIKVYPLCHGVSLHSLKQYEKLTKHGVDIDYCVSAY